MREENEQKGVGLMFLYRTEKNFRWKEIENRITDILEVEGMIGDLEVKILLCYFKTATGGEINNNNNRLKDYIVGRIEEIAQDVGIIVLGDFNGHLGYLGDQIENKIGKIVNDMKIKGT